MDVQRVAIVTGASSGIGRALAERAVRAGWRVLGVGRRAERLDELARSLALATGAFEPLALELREPDAARRIVHAALERFGRLDVLVNNAGATAVGEISQQSDGALREMFEVHGVVPLGTVREAREALRASRGQVIFLGSGVALVPVPGLGAYPPAKAAVRNLARIARRELAPLGIAVTYVDPGAVATEFMTRSGLNGPHRLLAVAPAEVARRIFAAFESRPRVLNAVPWQSAAVAIGAAFPALTDALLALVPQIVGEPFSSSASAAAAAETAARPEPTAPAAPTAPPADIVVLLAPEPSPDAPPDDEVAAALAPLAERMRRHKLPEPFVRKLLVPGTQLELGEVAMRWAGMPNKHERALVADVLAALAGGGFLEAAGEEGYRVVRAPDAERSGR
ncbi:MAG: SDR family NAD(P)-dependent oxidoreductase [Vulcanimicrobiaceae bacterium]